MILADKIIENRKRNGWSQEELADKLGVSRQSVSKWEGAQAVPDMKKIVMMSEIFGVSTDYLLRDDMEIADPNETAPVDRGLEDAVRSVSMEEASSFLEHNERAASRISTGVMMCILSPVLLIVVSGLAEAGFMSLSTAAAEASGTAILIIIVAIAVALFVRESMRGKPYEYLDNTAIDTEYGVSGMVRERRDGYAEKHTRLLILGIMMCIIGAVPMLIMEMTRYSNNTDLLPIAGVAAMLIIVAAGVKLIVLTCIRQGGYDRLLEEGDYTRLNKKAGKYDGIYWAIATAVYLGWSFVTMRWEITWIVWPVAGVLFAAYREVMKAIVRSR
jgi:transcriptional regulator with XRE-family HTH domain